jgi:hypothetical protein
MTDRMIGLPVEYKIRIGTSFRISRLKGRSSSGAVRAQREPFQQGSAGFSQLLADGHCEIM